MKEEVFRKLWTHFGVEIIMDRKPVATWREFLDEVSRARSREEVAAMFDRSADLDADIRALPMKSNPPSSQPRVDWDRALKGP
ncbi:hypothetical protein HDU84_003208 [Entophlyctis sp. JEL0112]|nr:hypothetical protein HDU84_003208 [Entophlyctis sp. JEL0112]